MLVGLPLDAIEMLERLTTRSHANDGLAKH